MKMLNLVKRLQREYFTHVIRQLATQTTSPIQDIHNSKRACLTRRTLDSEKRQVAPLLTAWSRES
ncbi:hypothetical protein WG66_007639 [Moniliophthora roreri]|nr:hypothetical protein WG66_007639 [Moniliophthora roreri]